MPRLPVVKTRELIRALTRLGFFEYHRVGSHAQFKHSDGRRVTIPIHGGKDIGKKTLKGIIDDLKIGSDEFVKILRD